MMPARPGRPPRVIAHGPKTIASTGTTASGAIRIAASVRMWVYTLFLAGRAAGGRGSEIERLPERGLESRLIDRVAVAHFPQDGISPGGGADRVAPRIDFEVADARGDERRLRERQLAGGAVKIAVGGRVDAAPAVAEVGARGQRVQEIVAAPRLRQPVGGGQGARAATKRRALDALILEVQGRQVLDATH